MLKPSWFDRLTMRVWGHITSIPLFARTLSGHPSFLAFIAWTLGSSPREKEESGIPLPRPPPCGEGSRVGAARKGQARNPKSLYEHCSCGSTPPDPALPCHPPHQGEEKGEACRKQIRRLRQFRSINPLGTAGNDLLDGQGIFGTAIGQEAEQAIAAIEAGSAGQLATVIFGRAERQ